MVGLHFGCTHCPTLGSWKWGREGVPQRLKMMPILQLRCDTDRRLLPNPMALIRKTIWVVGR